MYHRMAELVRNGRIGKLQKIEVILPKQPTVPGDPTPQPVPAELDYEMWLGPAPYAPYTKDRVHFNFRWIWDYSGGIICDWGAHLFDTAQWANDTERSGPIEVEGKGTHWEGGLYNTVKDYDVTYRYANGVIMTCVPGNPSIKFIGTDGWVGNRGWRGPLEASSPEILNSVIGPNEIHLYTNPEGEHDDFLKCVKSRKDPYFPVDIGHRVSTRLPPGQHLHPAGPQAEVGSQGRALRARRRRQQDALAADAQALDLERDLTRRHNRSPRRIGRCFDFWLRRFVEPMLLQFGVNGLRQARLLEADHLRALHSEELLQFGRGIKLNHRIVGEISQHLRAALLRDVERDEHEVQLALAPPERLASDQQDARPYDKREQPFHRFGRSLRFHHATFTLALRPLIWVRFSLEMMLLACSDATSTNRCRSRMSTAPTTLRGNPVSPRIVPTMSGSETPISAPVLT